MDLETTWDKSNDQVWSYGFNDVPYANENGDPYTYQVEEGLTTNTKGETYLSTIDGYELTNTITGTVDLTIDKTWFDHDDLKATRPQFIEVNVYQWIDDQSELYQTITMVAPKHGIIETLMDTPNNTWSYTIENLPKYDDQGRLYQYTVEEVKLDGYTSVVESQPQNTVDSTQLNALITNTAYGDLTISKTVSVNRGDANGYFTFTITLDEPINGSYGSTIFTDGKATVSLKHGETISINGLPVNIGYTIQEVEANTNGYTTSDSGNTTGMIIPSETIVVSFENRNHYIPKPKQDTSWTSPQPTVGYQFVLTDDK